MAEAATVISPVEIQVPIGPMSAPVSAATMKTTITGSAAMASATRTLAAAYSAWRMGVSPSSRPHPLERSTAAVPAMLVVATVAP